MYVFAPFGCTGVAVCRVVPGVCPILLPARPGPPGQSLTKHGLPAGLGFSRPRALALQISINYTQVLVGYAGSDDFPDSPEDDWATARAYREHVLRVVARLREDPEAAVLVAEVDERGRRLQPWAPGDESVRPKVLAGIRAALSVKGSGA